MTTTMRPLVLLFLAASVARAEGPDWTWAEASPGSQGMNAEALESAWDVLKEHHTSAFVVIRHDRIVFERYAEGFSRSKPHYTASMAKALVGGLSLMLAMDDGLIGPDDKASKYVPQWRDDAKHQDITIRHLATHTSGIEDAEQGDIPHDRLTGWKGDFWKRLPPPRDPFSLARDEAPVLEKPGLRERYSNPGMAMLGYCVTASLRDAPEKDLRTLLKRRVMDPLGVPGKQWSVGYGKVYQVDGLPLVATWGGGGYSPDAVARVGRLLLHRGQWEGRQLIDPDVVARVLEPSGMPGHSGLGWWVNRGKDGTRLWKSAPEDAFGGAGAGHQVLVVVPSLDLIVVRNGSTLDPQMDFAEAEDRYVIAPVVKAVQEQARAPYPPSTRIKEVRWAPRETVRRAAFGSDNWPMTWADDDDLYTAYGDGRGFRPFAPRKLSLGFAKVVGGPEDFQGANIASSSGEQLGDGARGKKASGMLMVDGVLYLWARNAGNAQLAWSDDHAKTWTWSKWRLETSFGCPSFLNLGRNYEGSKGDYVYIYSPDTGSAYEAADGMVLARVPKDRITRREAYEFFSGLDTGGEPRWSKEIGGRKPVFRDQGRCGRSSVSYNAGLRRYFWCQTLPGGDARFRGGFAIYDAPEPWGPWTTVFFTEEWDEGPGESCSLPTKWMSGDGRTVHLVFSGQDAFSVRKAELVAPEE